LNELTRSSATA